MQKLVDFVKENKFVMCLCWVIIICVIFVFFSNVLGNMITIIQLMWVCGIGVVLYWAMLFTFIYLESNNKLKWISTISEQFVHMQIFLDNNVVIVEVLEGEQEVFEKQAHIRGFKTERISESNGLVKLILK